MTTGATPARTTSIPWAGVRSLGNLCLLQTVGDIFFDISHYFKEIFLFFRLCFIIVIITIGPQYIEIHFAL